MKKIFILILLFIVLSSSLFFSKDISLVLSGGGAKGVYQLGVWKALIDNGYDIDGVYGTSVGAINGAAITMGNYEFAKNLWMSIDYKRLMEVEPKIIDILKTDMTFETLNDYFSVIWELITNNGIKIQPMIDLIYNSIDEEKIRNSKVDYGLVTVNYSNFEGQELFIEDIPEGELKDYILASSNFPGFQRYVIEEEKYIDGGFYSNVPVSMAVERGRKNILSVTISLKTPKDIITDIKLSFDKDINHIRVSPSKELGGFLDFDPDSYYEYIKLGYLDTQRVLGNLAGENYFIIDEPYEYLKEILLNIPEEKSKTAFSILNLKYVDNTSPEYNYYRVLLPYFEKITLKSSPSDVLNEILEKLADYLKLDDLLPYTRLDLIKGISSGTWKNKEDSFIIMNKRIFYKDLIHFFNFVTENCDCEIFPSEFSEDFKNKYREL